MDNSKTLWIVIGLAGVGICSLACIAVAILGIVMFGIAAPFASVPQSAPIRLSPGSSAPDFELATLNGDTVALSQFRGSPVLLDMSETWCPDCKHTAPDLQRLHETYPDLVVLGVLSNESTGTIQEFADEYRLTYTIALDRNGTVSRQYFIYAIPTLFFIDSDGVIQDVVIESYSEVRVDEALMTIGITP